jgi:hypothetical protein
LEVVDWCVATTASDVAAAETGAGKAGRQIGTGGALAQGASRGSGRGGTRGLRTGARSGGGGSSGTDESCGGSGRGVGNGEINFALGLVDGTAADFFLGRVAAHVEAGGEADRDGATVTETVAAAFVPGTGTGSVGTARFFVGGGGPGTFLSVDAAEFARFDTPEHWAGRGTRGRGRGAWAGAGGDGSGDRGRGGTTVGVGSRGRSGGAAGSINRGSAWSACCTRGADGSRSGGRGSCSRDCEEEEQCKRDAVHLGTQ